MESFLLDARYALRRLRLSPAFTIAATLIIGLGIGGNTAIFSIVNALLLRPQPYERPHELVNVYVSDSDGETFATASYPEFRDLRASGVFAGVTAFDAAFVNRLTPEGAQLHFAEAASGEYWSVLGLRPSLGRLFTTEDDQPGSPLVAVIGYRTWSTRFGADSALIGNTINLNGHQVTVIGVGPREYDGVIVGLGTELWIPSTAMGVIDRAYGANLDARNSRSTWIKARMKEGTTLAQADQAVTLFMSQLATEYPRSNEGRRAQVVPAAGTRLHPAVDRVIQPVAGFLLLVVALVLAIACSNLANLLLASATRRQREVAIRLALGAERGRLVRQFLVESVAIGVLGGAVGLVLAVVLVQLLMTFQPPIPVPVKLNVGVDGTVLAFTAVLSIATGVLFGLAPALRASRPDLVPALKTDTATTGQRQRRFGLRNVLVVSQVAGSLVLLVVAGLLVRHLQNSQAVNPGFETERVVLVTVSTGLGQMTVDQSRDFFAGVKERLGQRPDVHRVALSDRIPLGATVQTRDYSIDGYTPPSGETSVELDIASTGPGYFDAMRIPMVAGRDFSDRDDATAPRVAIVSEALAQRYWGTNDVIGRVIRPGTGTGAGDGLEIVGVARDTRVRTLGEDPRPYLYVPLEQGPAFQARHPMTELITIVVGTNADPQSVLAAIRADLNATAPGVPVFEAKTMPQHLQLMLFLPRVGAGLLSLFGMLAMILALTGLYGVIAFAVSLRTRELGIRSALGARPGQVTSMVVREGLRLVGIGAALSLLPALAVSRLLSGVLFQVPAFDVVTFLVAGLLFGTVAFVASYIPARRAARVDPLVALRYD